MVTWAYLTRKENDMAATYLCNSSVRGYHVYQSAWSAEEGENLVCKREMSNPLDSYAVIVIKGEQTVGHLPRKISRLCTLFLGRGSSITANVTGRRRRSVDLPQGGLEIPCRLTFSGPEESITKVRSLMDKLNLLEDDGSCTKSEDLASKETTKGAQSTSSSVSAVWVRIGRQSLSYEEKEVICTGQCLTDNHINYIQGLIREQFPTIRGLTNTLMAATQCAHTTLQSGGLQVLFCRGGHWIVVSTMGCPPNTVNIYDSVYKDIDATTKGTLAHLLGIPETDLCVNMAQVMQQVGGDDCGIFAAAVLTSLAHGQNGPFKFKQVGMRAHLVECMEKGMLCPFPG